MSIYKIDFQFRYQTEYWTNKFYVIGSGGAVVANWITDEAGPTLASGVQASVTLEKARVTISPFVANSFFDVPINLAGTGGGTPPAPLFNVVRWQFGRAIGRSVFHYFRGGVTPSNIGDNQNFTSAAKTFNDALVASFADTSLVLCDRNGNTYSSFTTALAVGMHQLRRGSRRKSTPVI